MNQDAQMRQMHIVLTGVNGFIGNQVLEAVLKLEPAELGVWLGGESPVRLEVTGSDLESTTQRFTAKRFAGSARYRYVDYKSLLNELQQGLIIPSAIIHNGACSSTTESDPEVFRSLNLDYSQALWAVCSRLQVPLIYASSASVYGNGEHGFDDHPASLEQYQAMNLYAKSKLDFDRFSQAAPEQPPLWFGLRYFNVYGPFEAHKGGQASMVYHGFHQIMKTGKMRLFDGQGSQFGDGEQMRDFVYVKDVVNLTMTLLKSSLENSLRRDMLKRLGQFTKKNGCFINVGTGKARSWNSLAASIFAALGKDTAIEYIPMPESLRKQYQDFTQAEQNVMGLLGLSKESTSLEDGVAEYVTKILLRNIE